MDTDGHRCLTCYESLTEEEYIEHKALGHVTLEFIVFNKWSTTEPNTKEEDK